MDRYDIGTLLLVLLLVSSQGAVVLAQSLTHRASSGVTYQTTDGLEVTLGQERDVEAVPFGDDQTFADGNVSISSPGSAAVVVNDDTYAGDSMTVGGIDASSNEITFERSDGIGPLTVEGGVSSVVVHDIEPDDNETDFSISTSGTSNVTIPVPSDIDGVQAVDSNGDVITGDERTADGTATLTFETGTYDVRIQDGPSVLEIRDLTTQDLVKNDTDPINVEIQFFGDEGAVEQRNTTDGTIDMTGLPIDQRFSVSVDGGDKYVQRQILIPSLLEQQTAWLLPQTTEIETVEPRFTLSDPSNQFGEERSEIILERPITINGSTEFVAVAGDRIGINGYDTILERDQRYRVRVNDPVTGASRQVGEFTPTQSEPVTLEVEDIEFDSTSEVEGLEWTARYIDNEDSADEVQFIFRDTFTTQSLDYQIYERGNKTNNRLVSGSATGNVTITEPIPPGENGTVWMVEWNATRATGETLSAQRPVSSDEYPVGPPEFPERWQIIASMLGLFGVAGLFGAANPGIGGIAVASTGGLLYMVGWLPDRTGGIMVILALFIAVLSYAGRRARGATA
jgi:hypothetical protein